MANCTSVLNDGETMVVQVNPFFSTLLAHRYSVQQHREELGSEFNLSIRNNRQSLCGNHRASALIEETDKTFNDTSVFCQWVGRKKGKTKNIDLPAVGKMPLHFISY